MGRRSRLDARRWALDDVLAVRQHHQFAHDHCVALGRVLTTVADSYRPYITASAAR